ncbi:MAG: hypothetical protein GEU94_02205 [Micromonosporaceae bacterium]|nr:hypothetical protein [Micromonosporaceae bacterium]
MREKAQRRLLEAAEPAAVKLIELMRSAESESVALAAARDLLDRAGLGVAQLVELTARVNTPYDALLREYMEQKLHGAQSEVDTASSGAGTPDQIDNVVDAEIIDDGHDYDNPSAAVQYVDEDSGRKLPPGEPDDWLARATDGPTAAAGFEERAERGASRLAGRARELARAKYGQLKDTSAKPPRAPRGSLDRYWSK